MPNPYDKIQLLYVLINIPINNLIFISSFSKFQHQSARFLGPPRERSPDHLTNSACQINANNNNINHRTCISCTDTCDHNSLKPGHGGGIGIGSGGGHLGPGHLYPDSCHSYDSAPDRLIADRPNYYTDLNRSDCSDASSGVLNSCIQLKSEPPGGPSSPESSTELPPSGLDECAGCDMPIQVGCESGSSIGELFSCYLLSVIEDHFNNG